MTDYDKIADDLHRKSVADRLTAEEITSRIMCDDSPGGPYLSLSGGSLRSVITTAVRIARGEVEIP